MKKLLNIILVTFAGVLLFSSCDINDPIVFKQEDAFVAFPSSSGVVSEQGAVIAIPVMVTAVPGSPAVTVDFEFSAEGLDNPAVEGVDFEILNESKTLSYPNGWGYDTIRVKTIDNSDFTGNKSVNILLSSNSQGYSTGANDQYTLTVKDDEHPLGKWIGTFSVEAKSYGSPGAWDEAWTVTSEPDPADVSKLILTGIAYGNLPISATVDLDAMTITIAAGADVGDGYGYGNILLYVGDENLNLNKSVPIVGEISDDGSIHIDFLGEAMTGDYDGYVWDVFDTYWTLQ